MFYHGPRSVELICSSQSPDSHEVVTKAHCTPISTSRSLEYPDVIDLFRYNLTIMSLSGLDYHSANSGCFPRRPAQRPQRRSLLQADRLYRLRSLAGDPNHWKQPMICQGMAVWVLSLVNCVLCCGVEPSLWTATGKAISNSWVLFQWHFLKMMSPKFHWFILVHNHVPTEIGDHYTDTQIGHFYISFVLL